MVAGERPGRTAGTERSNRERVLTAAREEFATTGFRGTTLRSIARRAGVDVALLAHYFSNKEGLFAATLELPDSARGMIADALSGPVASQGERLTRGYLMLWEQSATRGQVQALARSALSNEAASGRMRALLAGALAGPDVSPLVEHRRAGFTLAMAQLLGVAFARHLLRVPPVVDLDLELLVARTAPAIQQHLEAVD